MPAPTRIRTVALGLVVFWSVAAGATSPAIWQDVAEAPLPTGGTTRGTTPVAFRLVALDRAALEGLLAQVPAEASAAVQAAPVELPLPMPDGTFSRFQIVETPVMAPELARRFPEIRTYRGQDLDDPTATLRFDLTPRGFHAQILRAGDSVYIDPLYRGETVLHQSYLKRDLRRNPDEPPFVCHVTDPEGHADDDGSTLPRVTLPATPSGTTLRTYRLALAGTGEYTTAVCAPNPADVTCGLAAMVTSMNRVNGVYEREVAIRMVLVANNDLLVYTSGAKDPYTNGSGSTMLGENQSNLDAVIGSANYDIGHVFSTGGGGVAYVGVPCQAGMKAQGVTGRGTPIGDPFDIDYVAHEMGHQWGGYHTFNGTTGSCSGNRSSSAAYEPGSGSTIMAYAGICGTEDLQPNSDDVFHTKSFDQIVAYSTGTGNTCAQQTATGNTPPTVDPGASYTVPRQTPFILTGSATDPNGDVLSYLWEEYDLGTASPPQGDTTATRPIFRSFTPSTSPSRTFPKLSDILSSTQTFGEWMSNRTRTMTFRLTVRDHRVGG
ncbi:MAG: M12 family metallo-peptidase, partial [Thermoanaerobaculaceae bacterium]|nr:M12 family metallo-peptidase [Thermoanaerobaculaceae bacterium]